MKVKELIETLKTFDPELTVAVADWFEEYGLPADEPLSDIRVKRIAVWNDETMNMELRTRLVIGDGGEEEWDEDKFRQRYPTPLMTA